MFPTDFSFERLQLTTKKRLMVVSAKGGVGKSTTTVNLAAALAARGLKVGIFDADVHGPNIPALLGLRRKGLIPEGFDVDFTVPIAARPDSRDLGPLRPVERYGMKVVSLALLVGDGQTIQPVEDAIPALVNTMINRVDWGQTDVLLVDMPPGTGEPLQSILGKRWLDGAVVVTTREQLAHLDNSRLLSLLKRKRVPVLGVVENMTHIVCPKCGELIELYPSPVTEEGAVYGNTPVLASIPFDPLLIRKITQDKPAPLANPESPIGQILLELADRVREKLDL